MNAHLVDTAQPNSSRTSRRACQEPNCSAEAQTTVSVGVALGPSLERFLTHLGDYRDCSGRTVDAYRRNGESFTAFLFAEGVTCVEEVRSHHGHRFAAQLAHLAPATIRCRMYSLRSWFRYLVNTGLIATNPLASVEVPKRRAALPAVPSEPQCQALLDACETPTERFLMAVLLMAGLRKSEALHLTLADVSAGYDEIRVQGKGRRERLVPLCEVARDALKAHLHDRSADCPFLLCNRSGGPMGSTTLYRMFRKLLVRAGLADSGLTPHSLRHAFGTYLIRHGVDVATVAELMGHSNISTTSVYLHSDTTTKRAAVERLPWNEARG